MTTALKWKQERVAGTCAHRGVDAGSAYTDPARKITTTRPNDERHVSARQPRLCPRQAIRGPQLIQTGPRDYPGPLNHEFNGRVNTMLTDELFASGYELEVRGVVSRQTWRGQTDVPVDRARALAFTREGDLLLVCGDFGFQLPGGGVEGGESVSEALHRELREEAAARITSEQRLGAVQIDFLEEGRREYHDFYCCRISLESGWVATDEISERITVPPGEFLQALHWGRSDPKAAFLLERALQTVGHL